MEINFEPPLSKIFAIREGLCFATSIPYSNFIIELDCLQAIKLIRCEEARASSTNCWIEEIKRLTKIFSYISFNFYQIDCNGLANRVAKNANLCSLYSKWCFDYPLWIINQLGKYLFSNIAFMVP